jgi:hypothetical protein
LAGACCAPRPAGWAARDLLALAFSRPAALRFDFCSILLGIYKVFKANWNAPPRLDWPWAIFYGFSVGFVGVTGHFPSLAPVL